MKRVLLFTLEYPPDRGGVATYLQALHADLPNVTVVRARSWSWWPRWLPIIFQLFSIIKKEGIEFVAISHALPVGYAAFLARWLLHTPYGVFVHGLDVKFATKNPWKRWWFKKVLESAKWIVANSMYTKNLVTPYVSRVPVIVLYPCVRTCAPIQKKSGDGYALLTVGRLVARKNHLAVIQVLAELRERFPKLTYTIVGDGPERNQIMATIHKHDLTGRVIIVTNATDAQREAYYEEADIFISPTISHGDDVEGFGIVFLEAARHGLPVIAGRGGGVEEAVVDGKTGLVVDPLDYESLKRALILLIEHPDERDQMGIAARERVATQFLCGARKRELETLYG